jgi:hypothetical protein
MVVLIAAPARLQAAHRVRRVGWLSIESRPPDPIRLYINGRRAGVTPVRRLRVRAGKRLLLEAIRPDGVRQRRVLRLRPGQERHLILVS